MKKIKNYYFIYLVAIVLVFILSTKLLIFNTQNYGIAPKLSFSYLIFINTFCFGLIGFILGLEYLLKEYKKEGKFNFKLKKFLTLGLPSLILSMIAPISLIFTNGYNKVINVIQSFMDTSLLVDVFYVNPNIAMIMFNIVFGFVLCTSFYKED
ncbi:hypothetical protein KW94_20415 [Clostridioides difficile]|nr:hypothetical protein KW94_20415 [Clostridioides difficile]